MKRRGLSVVIERDAEGYYVASVPELPGCHTQAKSLDVLDRRVREASDLFPGKNRVRLTRQDPSRL